MLSVDDLLARLPGNLSNRARADLVSIARYTLRHFGSDVARASVARLLARAKGIEGGQVFGHPRDDVRVNVAVNFVSEPPWIFAFRPDSKQVLRILHGSRDFPRIFGRTTPGI